MSTIEPIVPLQDIPEIQPDNTVESDTIGKQTKKRRSRMAVKPLSLFEHLIQIGTLHEKEGGTPDTIFKQAKKHIDFVCKILDLTPLQAVLFADVLYVCDGDGDVFSHKLAELMKCRPIEIYGYLNQFEILERKSLLEIVDERRSQGRFKIYSETLQTIQKGECPPSYWAKEMTPHEFMERVATLCEDNAHNNSDQEQVLKKLGFLLDANTQLGIVKMIRSYGLSNIDNLILVRFCVAHVIADEEELSINDLPGCKFNKMSFTKAKLHNGTHPLHEKGIIEHANHDGFSHRTVFHSP